LMWSFTLRMQSSSNPERATCHLVLCVIKKVRETQWV
jgi:hypothetical protein